MLHGTPPPESVALGIAAGAVPEIGNGMLLLREPHAMKMKMMEHRLPVVENGRRSKLNLTEIGIWEARAELL